MIGATLRLRLESKTPESSETASLALVPADGSAPPPFSPGQYLTLEVPVPGYTPVVRFYSLSNGPGEPAWRITVKAEPPRPGKPSASSWLVKGAKPGALLAARPPEGGFTLDASDDPVVFLAAGIGVTPLASFLHGRATTGSRRPLHAIACYRRGAEAPLKGELESLARATGARLDVLFSQPAIADQLGRDFARAGRLTTAVVQELIPPDDRPYLFYLCGPPPFLHDLESGLVALGVPESRIRVEVFGPAAVQEVQRATRRIAARSGPAVEVEFARAKKKVAWDPAVGNLFTLAERSGVAIPYACLAGRCGSCLTPLLEGEVEHAIKPGFATVFPGYCLPCVATPKTRVVLDT